MAERHPDTYQRLDTVKEFDRVAAVMARRAAGLPDYAMDDPGRPFTPEYDDPPTESVVVEPVDEVIEAEAEDVAIPEDTTPSADAREAYIMPRPETLRDIRKQVGRRHIAEMRANLDAARAKQAEDLQPGHGQTKHAS